MTKWWQSPLKAFQASIISKRSIKSQNLHPKFKKLVKQLIFRMALEGYTVDVFSGYRSFEAQRKLYNKGRTSPGKKVTNARAGSSWHNYGLAVDLVFKTPSNKWSWAEYWPWDKLGKIGKELGLEWGGDFRTFKDRPHFQLRKPLRTSEAIKLHKSGGLASVWKKVN